MRRLIAVAGGALGVVLLVVWSAGGFDWLAGQAALAQRDFQNGMAGTLRALKAGDAGAIVALVALSFGYGVAHAAGPGHGKFLIGGYGLGRRVGLARLAWIALASSLAQAATAIGFVGGAFLLLDLTRDRIVGIADQWLEPLSYALIGLVGLWLVLRGLHHLAAILRRGVGQGGHHHPDHARRDHGHDHQHNHGHSHGPDCGHAHLPTVGQIADATTWREIAVLIGSVAVRPCTGAIFVLILTFSMGLPAAGIAATLAMGLGTAAIVLAVATTSVAVREGALAVLSRSRTLAVAMPMAEILAGGLVAAIAAGLVYRAL